MAKIPEETGALHRYFIWANRFRDLFDRHLQRSPVTVAGRVTLVDDEWLFMAYWYASLYVVIEGWEELGLSDSKLDTLLASSNVAVLKRFRNGIFHYQKRYFDTRLTAVAETSDFVDWVRKVNRQFGQYFLDVYGV